MKSIAIVGAGGFVGNRLIESLVLDGSWRIVPVIRSYRSMATMCRFGNAIDVRLANAENAAALTTALTGVDTVVNITTGRPAGIIRSTSTIHEACVRAGVARLVHMSSAVVYGDVLSPVTDDAAPPAQRHWMPYARAKATSEIWLAAQLAHPSLDTVVLRPGIVWGVRSPHTLDIATALRLKRAFVVGEGRGIFNGIYIDNLVDCIRTSCAWPDRVSGFYNVGDEETTTWADFFAAVGPHVGCDVDRLPRVSDTHFPRSIGSTIDSVQSLPMMNEAYHALKTYIPDGLKAALRARLEGAYGYDRFPAGYATTPPVSREMWHLQRVRHKLPTDKFRSTFNRRMPVSFSEGIVRTAAWLTTLGWTPGTASPVNSAG